MNKIRIANEERETEKDQKSFSRATCVTFGKLLAGLQTENALHQKSVFLLPSENIV